MLSKLFGFPIHQPRASRSSLTKRARGKRQPIAPAGGVRAYGFEPLEPRLMLTVVVEVEGNNSISSGQALPADSTVQVEGRIAHSLGDVDYYRVAALAGDTISLELAPVIASLVPGQNGANPIMLQAWARVGNNTGARDADDIPQLLIPYQLPATLSEQIEVAASVDGVATNATVDVSAEVLQSGAFVWSAQASAYETYSPSSNSPFGVALGSAGFFYHIRTDRISTVRVETEYNVAPALSEGVQYRHLVTDTSYVTVNTGVTAQTNSPPDFHSVSVIVEIVPLELRLGLFDEAGNLLAEGDTSLDYTVDTCGEYYVGVADHRDDAFNGRFDGRVVLGEYDLTVNLGSSNIGAACEPPDIRPVPGDTDWNFDVRGLDVAYEILDAALPNITDIRFFWSNGNGCTGERVCTPAAPVEPTVVAEGPHELHLEAAAFQPPPTGTTHLIIIYDQAELVAESDEWNNEHALLLEVAEPSVQIILHPDDPDKGDLYTVHVSVGNNGPVPLEFTANVHEVLLRPATLEAVTTQIDSRWSEGADGVFSGDLGVIHVGGAPVAYLLGSFLRKWEWIPEQNPFPINLMADFFVSKAGLIEQLVSGGRAATQLMSNIATALSSTLAIGDALADGEAEIVYFASASDTVLGKEGSEQKNVELEVSSERWAYLLASLAESATASGLLGSAFAALIPAPPLAVGLFGLSLGAYFAAHQFYELAKDPPDPNFTERTEVQPISIAEIDAMPAGPLKNLVQQIYALHSLGNAEATARNRADGAAEANSPTWLSTQLIDASKHGMDAAVLASRASGLMSLMNLHLQASVRDNAVNVPEYLEEHGLPDSFVSGLRTLGWEDQQIASLEHQLREADPAAFANTEMAATALKVGFLHTAVTSLKHLKQGIQIRVGKSEAAVRDLTTDEQSALAETRARIEQFVAAELPTRELFDAIESHVSNLHTFALETNNVEALNEELEFAHWAIVYLQQLDTSPANAEGYLNRAEAAGEVTADAAAAIQSQLTRFSEELTEGAFEAAISTLQLLSDAIAERRGDGVAESVAGVLTSYVSYARDLLIGDPATLPGDYNGNGRVEQADLDLVLLN